MGKIAEKVHLYFDKDILRFKLSLQYLSNLRKTLEFDLKIWLTTLIPYLDQTQGDTVLVPGVLKGMYEVWNDYGGLPWADLWEPCIDLAKKGFTIHESLANAIEAKKDYIMKNENLK